MKWFKNPETLEDLKKQYHSLAKKHHPDMGGSKRSKKSLTLDEIRDLYGSEKVRMEKQERIPA